MQHQEKISAFYGGDHVNLAVGDPPVDLTARAVFGDQANVLVQCQSGRVRVAFEAETSSSLILAEGDTLYLYYGVFTSTRYIVLNDLPATLSLLYIT